MPNSPVTSSSKKGELQTLKQVDVIELDIGMKEEMRAKVAEALAGLLASTYLLFLKTQYYHWNVTGSNFIGLHELFEKQYGELYQSGDVIAERIRALGHFTPGTVKEFLSFSLIKDDVQLPSSSEEMVANLLHCNEVCSVHARHVLDVAEKAKDEVTIDMMVHRMTQHDKNAWMLRSTLE
jgi:starvation-inducible DNA-binding protein